MDKQKAAQDYVNSLQWGSDDKADAGLIQLQVKSLAQNSFTAGALWQAASQEKGVGHEPDIVKEVRVGELLRHMIESDKELYERILDTNGFAYYFNELTKLAQKPVRIVEVKSPAPDTVQGQEELWEEVKDYIELKMRDAENDPMPSIIETLKCSYIITKR